MTPFAFRTVAHVVVEPGGAARLAASAQGLADFVAAERAELKAMGVDALVLFGSAARGQAGEASDLDVVVEADWSVFDYRALIALSESLEDAFLRRIDLVTERSLSPASRAIIKASAVRVSV